jgi:hypothetical protein
MPIYMDAPTSSISDIYGYGLYADWRVGSNGDSSGDPSYTMGDDQGEEAWGYSQWDSDLSDGFDTGNISVRFAGSSDGSESLTVGSDATLQYSGDAMGTITSVEFRAGVMVAGEAKFSDINIQFYHDNTLVEAIPVGSGPDANTINSSSLQQEQTLTVTPTAPNVNKVFISATTRLDSKTDTAPATSDLFCNIFVFGSNS